MIIPFDEQPDLKTIERLNVLASTESSKLFCHPIPFLIPESIASVLCERDPSFIPFHHAHKSGQDRVLVQILKAQYGCVESARLWYEHISKALVEQDFQINPFDPCIFQRISGDIHTYITLYIDDLMIFSDEVRLVDDIIAKLIEKYKDLIVNRGKIHDYLGMRFDFSKEVFISMEA